VTLPSKRTRQIEAFIRKHLAEHGIPPSHREIMHDCRVSSTSVVSYHLDYLEDHGVITRDEGKARTIRLTDTPMDISFDVAKGQRYDLVPSDPTRMTNGAVYGPGRIVYIPNALNELAECPLVADE